MDPNYIILTYQAFKKYYQKLKEGDLIAVRLPLRKDKTGLIIDLLYRKVEAFPSFLSQLLSRSKTLQAEVLREFMLPYTYPIRDRNDLLFAMSELSNLNFTKFITKDDRADCGLGVRLWNSLEEIYNIAGSSILSYPFVLQPFYENWEDIRVIILGDEYMEAYRRINKFNFRQNLYFGGKSRPYKLSQKEIEFCKNIMKRGHFPFAHLDITYIDGKGPYLSEISLKGGIKGAQISTEKYEEIINKIRQKFLKNWEKKYPQVIYVEK